MKQTQVFRPFRNDHRRVLEQLDQLERMTLGAGRRRRLGPKQEGALHEMVVLLARQFATHMRDEEEVLYPSLAEAFPESVPSLGPLEVEHRELRSMLVRLASLLEQSASPSRDEQIAVQVRDLVDLLRIHIHKEEAAVFAVAARVLTPQEIRTLAKRIAAHHSGTERPLANRARMKGRSS